jgi:hypothetical protein
MALKIVRRKFSETLPTKGPKTSKTATEKNKIPSPKGKAGTPTKTTKKTSAKKRASTQPLAMNPDQRLTIRITRKDPPADERPDTQGDQPKQEAQSKAEP